MTSQLPPGRSRRLVFTSGLHRNSEYLRRRSALASLSDASGMSGRVGGQRVLSTSKLWLSRFQPPLPEPCVQLSLHTALQYRGLRLSTGFDLIEPNLCPCNRQSTFYRFMAPLADEYRLSS